MGTEWPCKIYSHDNFVVAYRFRKWRKYPEDGQLLQHVEGIGHTPGGTNQWLSAKTSVTGIIWTWPWPVPHGRWESHYHRCRRIFVLFLVMFESLLSRVLLTKYLFDIYIPWLTFLSLNKIAVFSLTTFSNVFPWMNYLNQCLFTKYLFDIYIPWLTFLSLNKIAVFSQTTFSNVFPWMNYVNQCSPS